MGHKYVITLTQGAFYQVNHPTLLIEMLQHRVFWQRVWTCRHISRRRCSIFLAPFWVPSSEVSLSEKPPFHPLSLDFARPSCCLRSACVCACNTPSLPRIQSCRNAECKKKSKKSKGWGGKNSSKRQTSLIPVMQPLDLNWRATEADSNQEMNWGLG